MNGGASFVLSTIQITLFAAVLAAVLYWLLRANKSEKGALQVYRMDDLLPGIPFYIKKSHFVQESAYLEPLATITLVATLVKLDDAGKAKDKAICFSDSKTVTWSEQTAAQIEEIETKLTEAQEKPSADEQWTAWKEVLKLFGELVVYNGEFPALPHLVSNQIREETYVDYKTVFYLNANQPLIGSANVSTKLAADGTLSESTATIEDSSLEKMLGILPIGEFIKAYPKAPAAQAAAATDKVALTGEKSTFEFRLEAERLYVRHIFSRYVEKRDYIAPISVKSLYETWYRREYVAKINSAEASSKEKGDKAAVV